ncbi:MAG TPA: winged helix-turn-helix domain-containing protein [Solirubrobacteraceae bacterium]|nr:winged helix-turn-helix domain-containing protein [Solirubrobacteraceae bacterium]
MSATAQPLSLPDPQPDQVIEVGPLQISPSDHIARAWGHALMLSVKELSLLTELARRADRVVGREELFRLAWHREMRLGDRSVDVYVRRLRVKLERAMPGWRFIHTHFGFGYRLSPERSQISDQAFTSQ